MVKLSIRVGFKQECTGNSQKIRKKDNRRILRGKITEDEYVRRTYEEDNI